MEYTVGSLSDLITGSNTPNKQKVVRKKLPKKAAPPSEDSAPEISKKPTPRVPAKKQRDGNNKGPRVGPKRKFQRNDNEEEAEPAAKLSKNNENAERRVKKKAKAEKPEPDPEQLSRTVFVGNLPITVTSGKLKTFFKKFGMVESVRLRGAPVADPKTPKKVAIIKKQFHPDRKSLYGYVIFEQREDAVKASEANGTMFEEHHIRVHLCDAPDHPDENKAIFIGNLNFSAEEEDLWRLFESCGAIASVRIVRDKITGMGKGFGYVNFQSADSVTLALEMQNVKVKDRELRIGACNVKAAKKNKKTNKATKISKPGKPRRVFKKEKPNGDQTNETKVDSDGETSESKEKSDVETADFQGVKFATKKKTFVKGLKQKKKFVKGLKQKKKIIKQIAPK